MFVVVVVFGLVVDNLEAQAAAELMGQEHQAAAAAVVSQVKETAVAQVAIMVKQAAAVEKAAVVQTPLVIQVDQGAQASHG